MDKYLEWLNAELENVVQNYPGDHAVALDILCNALAKYQEIRNENTPKIGDRVVSTGVENTGNDLRYGVVVDIRRKDGIAFQWAVTWDEENEWYANPPAYLLYAHEFRVIN